MASGGGENYLLALRWFGFGTNIKTTFGELRRTTSLLFAGSDSGPTSKPPSES